MKKKQILNLLVNSLQEELRLAAEAAQSARRGATEVEAKPENKYDTRGLEQAYLADGQVKRVQDLQQTIHHLKSLDLKNFDKSSAIDISALIQIQSENGELKTYFMIPVRGGIKVQIDSQEILSISPDSPLGDLVMGKRVGDSFELKSQGVLRSFEIISVE